VVQFALFVTVDTKCRIVMMDFTYSLFGRSKKLKETTAYKAENVQC
jgi:hypothetical protein